MLSSNINIFSDPQSLAEAACENFLDRAEIAVKQRGVFTVALSGGSTPSIMYKILVKKIHESSVYQELLQKIHFFWGDERHVSPKSPQSNFGNAYNDFFSKITISQDSIHRIKSEIKDASEAADDYEKVLRHFFQLKEGEFPIFDLIFLGMGLDGHTASLFPGNDALKEKLRLVIAPFVKKFDAYRVTLTLPVINSARCIIFLITGEEKAKILQQVFNSNYETNGYPVQLINSHYDEPLWFVDQSTAEYLSENSN